MVDQRRGEVWWASLPPPVGSQPGHRRPVLVVQSNRFNRSRIGTVLVAAITSNLALAEAPGNVRLAPAESGLPKPSVVNVTQILAVNRDFLTARVARLPANTVNRVGQGLRQVFGL